MSERQPPPLCTKSADRQVRPGVGGGAGIWWEFVGEGCLISLGGQRARDPAPLSFYCSGFTHQTHSPGAPACRWRLRVSLRLCRAGALPRNSRAPWSRRENHPPGLHPPGTDWRTGGWGGDRLQHPTEGQGRSGFRNREPASAQSHEEHLCPETGSP